MVVTLAPRERLLLQLTNIPAGQLPLATHRKRAISRHRAGLRHASQTIRNPHRARLRTSLVFVGRATAVVSRVREFRNMYAAAV